MMGKDEHNTNNTPTLQLNETSKRAFDKQHPLADYAAFQGVPVQAFIDAGYRETTYFCRVHLRNRPAFHLPDHNGSFRIRYSDGLEPRHDSPFGYQMSWYGLDKALSLSNSDLLIVNGIPSVIAAQWNGIPAICVSGGESAAFKPDMIQKLLKVIDGRQITVAYDCDSTGQKQASKRARQLIDAGFIVRAVDLQLGKNGDFANYVKLHGQQALNLLGDLPEIAPDKPKENRIEYTNTGTDRRAEFERTVVLPAIERHAPLMRGKHFHCINPSHADEHASGRVGKGTKSAVLYYCTCGTFSLMTVAKWLGLNYVDWLKSTYPGEWKPVKKASAKRGQNAGKKPSHARINGKETVNATLPSLPTFTADLSVCLSDLRQLDMNLITAKKTLVFKSATGTYKTGFIGEKIIASAPDTDTVLVLTHRVSLTLEIAKRYGLDHYKTFAEGYERSAPRLASTIDSADKQAGRKFDKVIFDEDTQGLAHLINAGTLKGKAAHTLEVIEQLIRDAGTVIFADANNNDSIVAWLKTLRPDVFTIENTHRPGRANTHFVGSQSGAIQIAINEVEAGQGVVLIPCAAQSTARKIHKLLTRLYPEKRGRVIDSRNSQTGDVQEFLAQVNDELPAFDWLVYTSSMGTGVNIHCPVAAVVGIAGQPVAPPDFMQMLGRARNAQKRFVYAPEISGGGETDASIIFDNRQRAAGYSAAYGAVQPDSTVQHLARLEAESTAQNNREMSAYRDTLAAYLLADGSAPAESFQVAKRDTLEALKQITEARAQAEKENVLKLAAITNEALDKLRDAGAELTDEIIDANLRYKIERSSGLTISEGLFDRLRTAENRRRLARFTGLIDDEQALIEFDRLQAQDRIPLHLRRNAAAGRKFFMEILNGAFGVDSIDGLKTAMVSIPKDDLAQRVAFIGIEYRNQLISLFGYRPDGHDASTENPVGLFRWLCARYFIKFESKRIRQGDKLTYAYSIDTAEFDAVLSIARARIAARLAEENDMFQKREFKTMPITCVFGTTPKHGETIPLKPPAPPAEAAQAAAKLDAIRQANQFGNPFSSKAVA